MKKLITISMLLSATSFVSGLYVLLKQPFLTAFVNDRALAILFAFGCLFLLAAFKIHNHINGTINHPKQ